MGAGNESFFEEGWMLLADMIPNAAAEFVLEGLAHLGGGDRLEFSATFTQGVQDPD